MKVSIEMTHDSYNSYPEGSVTFKITEYSILITIDGYDREVKIPKSEFKQLLKLVNQT